MRRPQFAVAAVPAAALGSVIAFAPQLLTNGPVLCPFRRLTGHECPTCGMTRACVAALRGDVATSFAAHPLGLPLLAAVLVYVLYQACQSMRSASRRSSSDCQPDERPVLHMNSCAVRPSPVHSARPPLVTASM